MNTTAERPMERVDGTSVASSTPGWPMQRRRDDSVAVYAAAWAVTGTVAALLVAVVAGTGGSVAWGTVAGLVALTAAAELTELPFRWSEQATASFTLIEVAVVADILLLPPLHAVVVVTVSVLLTQIIRWRPPVKGAFNVGQIVTATAAALAVTHTFPDVGPLVNGWPVLGAALGVVAYAGVNLTALVGLLGRLTDQSPADTLRQQGWLSAAAIFGNSAVGILLADLWLDRPELLPLLLAPAAAVHLAYRGTVTTNSLLAQIRTEHDRLDRVVIGTSDGIFLLDRRGDIELWNPAMEEMTGIPAHLAVGRSAREVLNRAVRDADDPSPPRFLVEGATPERPQRNCSVMLHHSDGTNRHVEESHTFLFDERGRPIANVVVAHDVTRQKELDALKSDFVARVSHELRTPLTPIKGFAAMLLRRGDDMDNDQRYTAALKISEQAEHMTMLVEDLLLVTRLQRGRKPITVTPVTTDLGELTEEVVVRFRDMHPERVISLWVAPDTGKALTDPERTRQVLSNLIDNAVRYTPRETPIEVEVLGEGDDICVRVIDHGPGVPRDKQELVFEQFHRLEDPLRMQTSGVGVGLYISRKLAEAMHGMLELTSTPGSGATFTLRLPADEPMAAVD